MPIQYQYSIITFNCHSINYLNGICYAKVSQTPNVFSNGQNCKSWSTNFNLVEFSKMSYISTLKRYYQFKVSII